jgi:hypothetical protein
MATAVLPLAQVAQRLAQQEAALQALRREYEARKKQLDQLTRRKQELQTQLTQVEGQIHSLAGGASPASAPAPKAVPASKARQSKATHGTRKRPSISLHQLLVTAVRDAGRPLSHKELVEEVRRRNFPTHADDLLKQVTTRVGELVKKGALRRTQDHKAVTLPTSPNGSKPTSKAPPATLPAKSAPAKSAGAKPTPPPLAKVSGDGSSLRPILMRLLQHSKAPVGVGELARRARTAGVKSKSKDFPNLVGVTLGRMNGVERVPGQGYRLKKR